MKGYKLRHIGALLSYLHTAQCLEFETPLNKKTALTSTNCELFNNGRKCKFETKSLKLEVDDALQLVVKNGGRTISCNKTSNKGNKQWYGTCDGDANDANFITRVDKDGKRSVYGSIHVGDDVCRIGPNILGEEEIQCFPRTSFFAEDDPPHVPKDGSPEKLRMLAGHTKFGFVPAVGQADSQNSLRSNNRREEKRDPFDDSGGNIDIMVVWTTLAECANAGQASGCTVSRTTENMMRGLIDLAVAETNTAYELSGIFTVLRLVHAYRDPDYVQGSDFYIDLNRLTNNTDGFLDSVHNERALYGADVVQLITGGPNSCGIAWSDEPTKEYMFSVTRFSCATGYYSFGHEIGHNFGMYHDRGAENTCNETNTFNYAYTDPGADFRTILSYDCKMRQCDRMPKNRCPRIQRFSNSNPAYTYNGKPIGDAQRDNAKQFNDNRARVASFFPAMNCKSNTECNDDNEDTFDTCNAANQVCVFTPLGNMFPTNAPTFFDEPILEQQEEQPRKIGFFSMLQRLTGRFLSWLSEMKIDFYG